MSPRKGQGQSPSPAEKVESGWFHSTNASTVECEKWDINTRDLADAILGIVSTGRAIQFGTTRDRSAIYVMIYDGETKHRTMVEDAIDFEDTVGKVLQKLEVLGVARVPARLRAVGD